VVRAVFDTNILIDYLHGVTAAGAELERFDQVFISVVTWMEVMVGASADKAQPTEAFLNGFGLVPLDNPLARRAVSLRQIHRIKLPDAIIWATAQVNNMLLVTRNAKDFPPGDPGVRIPYTR
jgi:predicted nucleic acid-binding protein